MISAMILAKAICFGIMGAEGTKEEIDGCRQIVKTMVETCRKIDPELVPVNIRWSELRGLTYGCAPRTKTKG